MIVAVIGLIAAAALAGMFRPQLAQAWGSVSGSTQAQEEEVRLTVERYAQAFDRAGGEAEKSKVKARLNDGLVTERYWSTSEGRTVSDAAASDRDSSIYLVSNNWLAGWDLEECCAGGKATGVAEIGNDWRIFDTEQEPEDLSTPFQEGTYRTRVELVEQDGRWKVAWVEEIKDGG